MSDNQDFHEFNLVRGGAIDRLVRKWGLTAVTPRHRLVKVIVLFFITWVPLLVLSLAVGNASRGSNKTSFLHDPEVHARFLVTLPLLEMAEVIVAVTMLSQVRHLRISGLVPERNLQQFETAKNEALATRSSIWFEVAVVIASALLAIVVRGRFGIGVTDENWETSDGKFTLPGWWYTLVSTPVLYFFLIRWVCIFAIWSRFLYRVSRLDLQLTPTHPDRAGGIGFLAWGLICFATVVMAISTVFSAAFAEEILHHGESLDSLKYHIGIYVVCMLLIIHLPLFSFFGKLTRTRFVGLLEFSGLVWKYDRAFEKKWLEERDATNSEEFLGNSDISTLADVATPYNHICEMRMIPFDSKSLIILAGAAALPMLPLVGTQIPLNEIFAKLGELLM